MTKEGVIVYEITRESLLLHILNRICSVFKFETMLQQHRSKLIRLSTSADLHALLIEELTIRRNIK